MSSRIWTKPVLQLLSGGGQAEAGQNVNIAESSRGHFNASVGGRCISDTGGANGAGPIWSAG